MKQQIQCLNRMKLIFCENSLEKTRTARRKRMPGETEEATRCEDPENSFRIEISGKLFDQITVSIEEKFC